LLFTFSGVLFSFFKICRFVGDFKGNITMSSAYLETMLDTIDESNQTPKKHARSAKSNSVEKADKKSPSKKLSSSVVKSEANSMETLGNAKQKSHHFLLHL
jgi:hypothetical protein